MPRSFSLICMVCGSRCLPALRPGKSHGLEAIAAPVRRFVRLCKWSMSISAKGIGTGAGSAPSDIRTASSVTSTAVVFSVAIRTSGWA